MDHVGVSLLVSNHDIDHKRINSIDRRGSCDESESDLSYACKRVAVTSKQTLSLNIFFSFLIIVYILENG